MDPFRHVDGLVRATLADLAADGALPPDLDVRSCAVEPPRDPAHGDATTNAALVLAKPAGLPPRELAMRLAARLAVRPGIVAAEVAGPGFVNLRLADSLWRETLRAILGAGTAWGDSDRGGGRKVNVEYVSANPTGPLHAAHGRGAVVGDALANLLAKIGYDVTREYYVNDAGGQVDVLARSTHHRYLEALGRAVGPVAPGLYPGAYLVEVGRALAAEYGDRWADALECAWLAPVRRFATDAMMRLIREDLRRLGVRHDVFTSERALVEAGAIEAGVARLAAAGLIYRGVLEPPKGKTPEDWEPREQTLFAATKYGDDVDRPIAKSDGSWTYFAGDIAYHADKIDRGFDDMIVVLGADHGGYVKRLAAVAAALSGGRARVDVKLCQLVRLLDRGEPVKMSKRSGNFIELSDVVEQVGAGAVRFTMLTRRNDQAFDFDYAKVKEQSKDNPVWYVQYAHARCRSVLRKAAEGGEEAGGLPPQDVTPASLAAADLDRLTHPDDLALIRKLGAWPRTVEGAAEAHEPHRIAFYLNELAGDFHALWTKAREDATLRFLMPEDPSLTRAKLALVEGVRTVIASGLAVIGVEPVEEMR